MFYLSCFVSILISNCVTILGCTHTIQVRKVSLQRATLMVAPPPVKYDTCVMRKSFACGSDGRVYLCAVRSLHIKSGLPNPMDHIYRLLHLLRGIKRLYSQERRTRLPILPQYYSLSGSNLICNGTTIIMLWTAMLVAFFAFLRSAKLIALTISDISTCTSSMPCPLPIYILSIRASKTDPFRRGCQIRLAHSGHPLLCPAKDLTDYLQRTRLSQSSPLFVWASGTTLCIATLSNCIK